MGKPLITFDPAKCILAIDPARLCGFAHSNGQRGTWNLGATDRLRVFQGRLETAHEQWGVKQIVSEDATFGSGSPHVQAMHNELRGIIRLFGATIGVPVLLINPMTLKKYATGHGRAQKPQMMRACETFFGFVPQDDNVSDAMFLLLMADQGYVKPAKKKKAKPAWPRSRKPRDGRLF